MCRRANALRIRGGNVYVIDQGRCVKVGDCVNACPVAAIEDKGEGIFAISEDCTDCGACEPVCDAKAIHRVY
jgi:NAD-dependent dihydropyrimidine dehydrogenase PreA subunit